MRFPSAIKSLSTDPGFLNWVNFIKKMSLINCSRNSKSFKAIYLFSSKVFFSKKNKSVILFCLLTFFLLLSNDVMFFVIYFLLNFFCIFFSLFLLSEYIHILN